MLQKKIKVLHFISTLGIGGAERVLLSLAATLNREKYELIFAVLSNGRKRCDMTEEACKMGFPVETITYRKPYDISQLTDLYRIARRHHPEIIHTHGYKTNILGYFVAKLLSIPIMSTVHGHYQVGTREKILVKSGIFVLRRFDKVLPVSEHIGRELLRRKVPGSRMMTIRNVPPVNIVRSQIKEESFREEIGISTTQALVGFVGRLEHVKGCDQLIEAIAKVKQSEDKIVLVIVGDGPERQSLELLVAEKGLKGVVRFCGFRSDPERIFQSLDLVVLPSRSEGIPLTLLEAMAMGVPVIGTNVGGIPEVIEDKVNGLLVPSENPAALAQAIIESLGIPEEARKRSLKARETIEHEYDTEKWAGKIQDIYTSLVV